MAPSSAYYGEEAAESEEADAKSPASAFALDLVDILAFLFLDASNPAQPGVILGSILDASWSCSGVSSGRAPRRLLQ